MGTKFAEIKGNFFYDFGTADNIIYNSKILCNLVEQNASGIFNKMISIQACSILEACLYENIMRIQNYNIEGYPGLMEEERIEIASKKAKDKFSTIIDVLKKHKILDGVGEEIYQDLHTLRKLRNKVHIQIKDLKITDISEGKKELEIFVDHWALFSVSRCIKVITFLEKQKTRQEGRLDCYVESFFLPLNHKP